MFGGGVLAVESEASGGGRTGGRLPFRSDVEGLRAVAVLLVVAFHAAMPWCSGGFIGVDVFFVISGYLITALLSDELRRTGTISLPAFFGRRIRRLIPAAAVVLVTTLLLSAVVMPPLEIARTAASVQAAAGYVSNIHFLRLASDYFSGEAASSPIVHTWSLSVEEQFYIVWPLLLLLLARSAGRRELSRRWLAWTLTAIGALSFIAASFYTTANHSLAFYGTPLRAWEFAVGGLVSTIAWRASEAERGSIVWSGLLGWGGLALIICAGATYSAATEFPGVTALVPVAGTAMVLIAGAMSSSPRRSARALLSTAPMQWIGRRSYGWYLWHWPVLVVGAVLMPGDGALARIALAVASLPLAALTFRYVEMPSRAIGAAGHGGAKREWRIIRLGFAASLAVIAIAEAARQVATVASRSPAQRAFTAAAEDVALPYRSGCVNGENDDRVHVCEYGTRHATTTIALFGDSHATQWFPALEAIAHERNWGLVLIAKTRCATAAVPVYAPGMRTESLGCRRWRAAAMDTIRRRRPTFVVLSNALVYVRGPRLSSEVPAVSPETWTAGMIATLAAFRASQLPTIVIQDTPLLTANAPICLARSGWLGRRTNTCATSRPLAINSVVADAEQRAIDAVPGNHLIDLTDALCGPTICAPIVGGIIAYSDNEHLTASMARSLAPRLESALDDLKLGTLVVGDERVDEGARLPSIR
jgi:peptidoglycan/LPS O-acetylase OafA/YrhL